MPLQQRRFFQLLDSCPAFPWRFEAVKKRSPAFTILIVYTLLSWYFAYERILCIDNSNFFFHIVNEETFCFPENRVGIFLSQLPLLLCAKAGISLSVLIYLYSLTFPLFYLAIAWVCSKLLKVPEAAMSIALCLITGIAFSFFHPVTETYHALIFSLLLYAILVSPVIKQYPRYLFYIAILLSTALSLISHPVSVFMLGFIALYAYISQKADLTAAVFVLLPVIVSATLRVLFVQKGSYDQHQYSNLFGHIKSLAHITDLYPVAYLKFRLHSVYFPFILLVAVFTREMIIRKQLKLLVLSLLSALLYTILAIFTFSRGDADIMMEKTFLPGMLMIILPFCVLCFQQKKLLLAATLVIVFLLSFVQIFKASRPFTKRLKMLEQVVSSQPYPKMIASYSDYDESVLRFNHWNTGVDSYILAKTRLNKNATIFLTRDKHSFAFDSTDTHLFLGPEWGPQTTAFDQVYFQLPDVPYKVKTH